MDGTKQQQYTTFNVYGTTFKVDGRYQFVAALGRGSYGIVCSAKDLQTGEKVAIKRVSPMARKQNDAKHTLREICLMQSLGAHPNIISIRNMSVNVAEDELYIIMDFMDTDMHRVIQSSQPLSESHYKFFLHQILRGVKHMHDNGVLHRDLKPGNILVTKNCQVKIADFGLARSIPKRNPSKPRPASAGPAKSQKDTANDPEWQPMTEHVVTRWYRAPELMLQPDGHYSTGVDMWSVGCIFAEILGRKAVFPGKNFIHQLTLIFDVIGTPSPSDVKKMKSSQAQRFIKSLGKKAKVPFRTLFPSASADAIDLLEKLLQFDPSSRCTVDEALAHPYMQGIDKRYAYKDVAVPAGRLQMSFESQNLSKNDLVKLIQQEVAAFHAAKNGATSSAANSTDSLHSLSTTTQNDQPPAGIRTIHALSRQTSLNNQQNTIKQKDAGRVTCQNPDLMKTMLQPTAEDRDVTNQPPATSMGTTNNQGGGVFSLSETQVSNQQQQQPAQIVQVVGLSSLLSRTINRPASAARTRPPTTSTTANILIEEPASDKSNFVPPTTSARPSSAARARPPIVIPTTAQQPAANPTTNGDGGTSAQITRSILHNARQERAPHDSSSSSSDDDDTTTLKATQRPKSAPIRAALHKQTCVGSTSSLIKSQRQKIIPKKPQQVERALECQDNEVEPAKKGKKLTVPVSPKFSVMSWQKARPATAKAGKQPARTKKR